MKTIYTEKEKTIRAIIKIIQDYTWKHTDYKQYNIGYSPFHSELARILYEKGYRKVKRAKVKEEL